MKQNILQQPTPKQKNKTVVNLSNVRATKRTNTLLTERPNTVKEKPNKILNPLVVLFVSVD